MIVVFVVFTTAVLVVVVIAIKERRCKHALSLPDDPDHFAGLFDESVSKACGLLLGWPCPQQSCSSLSVYKMLTTRLPLFLLNFGVWSGAKVRTSCRFLLKTKAAKWACSCKSLLRYNRERSLPSYTLRCWMLLTSPRLQNQFLWCEGPYVTACT